MSRSLRVEVEGGWYHVISRGIERREIFRDDADHRDFLARLFALTESHEIRLHAYCLMKNHFHLQVETPKPNLKEAMQRLLSGYVVRFNLRHRRSGPLFQGRYRAILTGEQEWITEVNRYVHLNPVRLKSLDLGKQRQAEIRRGIEDTPDEALVLERLKQLREYPWSSYRAYAGYVSAPGELQTGDVLACFEGRTQQQPRAAFREHTESAIREGVDTERWLDAVRYGVLLGSEEWVEKIQVLLEGDTREQPALHAATKQKCGFEAIAAAIAEEFEEPWEALRDRRGHPARSLAIAMARRHTALKLKEIGEYCGGIDYAAVSQANHRMENTLRQNRDLNAAMKRITERIQNVKC